MAFILMTLFYILVVAVVALATVARSSAGFFMIAMFAAIIGWAIFFALPQLSSRRISTKDRRRVRPRSDSHAVTGEAGPLVRTGSARP